VRRKKVLARSLCQKVPSSFLLRIFFLTTEKNKKINVKEFKLEKNICLGIAEETGFS